MDFEWDEEKASANQTKHGVSFEEAQTVFSDGLYAEFYDPKHSDEENRFLIVGNSNEARLLLVCYTERNGVNRIITAREATKQERRVYQEGNN